MPRVTLLELPASWGTPARVVEHVASVLEAGPATDILLLPEASITGYVSPSGHFDPTDFAELLVGPTTSAIRELARQHCVNIVAPLVLKADEEHFNTMVAFGPRGEHVFTYRKRHPWFPERWATPGKAAVPLVTMAGIRVTICICYDIHFLEEEASDTLEAADLLLFPSAWVEVEDSRPEILASLARRHRVAIANANWGPGVVRVSGQGASAIYGPSGDVLASVAIVDGSARADAVVAPLPKQSR